MPVKCGGDTGGSGHSRSSFVYTGLFLICYCLLQQKKIAENGINALLSYQGATRRVDHLQYLPGPLFRGFFILRHKK